MKTNPEILKEHGITSLTKHHNYNYLYENILQAMKEAQGEAVDELIKKAENLEKQLAFLTSGDIKKLGKQLIKRLK